MSCASCGSNGCNCPSTTLPIGSDGTDAMYGGYSSDWKFDSSIAAGPASQYLRFNNATLSSVTILYISDTNQDLTSRQAFLDSFTNSSQFGKIRVFKEYDSNTFWEGTITANTDSGTYHTVTATYISSNGSFTAGDSIVVTFSPAGSIGATGPQGAGAQKYDTVSFTRDTPYVQTNVGGSVFTDLGQYIFPGTTIAGTPTQIRLNGWVSNAAIAGTLRVYDFTNSVTIAEQSAIISTSVGNIITPATQVLSNPSTGYAVWKIQGYVAGGGGGADYVRAASMLLGFY